MRGGGECADCDSLQAVKAREAVEHLRDLDRRMLDAMEQGMPLDPRRARRVVLWGARGSDLQAGSVADVRQARRVRQWRISMRSLSRSLLRGSMVAYP